MVNPYSPQNTTTQRQNWKVIWMNWGEIEPRVSNFEVEGQDVITAVMELLKDVKYRGQVFLDFSSGHPDTGSCVFCTASLMQFRGLYFLSFQYHDLAVGYWSVVQHHLWCYFYIKIGWLISQQKWTDSVSALTRDINWRWIIWWHDISVAVVQIILKISILMGGAVCCLQSHHWDC